MIDKRLLVHENQSLGQIKLYFSQFACIVHLSPTLPLSSVNREATGGRVACSSSGTGQGEFDDFFHDGLGGIKKPHCKERTFFIMNLFAANVSQIKLCDI